MLGTGEYVHRSLSNEPIALPWGGDRRAEEVWERSGDNDFVGSAIFTLRPSEWMGMVDEPIIVTSPGGEDCGDNPFTAHFSVTAQRY